MTGLLVNFSKAILFYISIMPGFFVLNQLTNTENNINIFSSFYW